MENKYNINRNRKPLTPEDVQQGQDFDAFMKAYSARPKPFYKTTTFYASVAAVGVVIAIGSYVLLSGPETPKENTAFVQAPLSGINVNDTAYTVDAASGGDFFYNTGSLIRVPEGAFLDSAGNTVKGNIELHYREFHDPASIFLAGIPMTYDSAGQRFHFESAGMFEITASLNGKPLKVNPDSPLKVALASNTNEDKFNVYYLDTIKKNWDFISKDKATLVAFEKDTANQNTASVNPNAGSAPVVPVMPKKMDNKKKNFTIRFEPNDFPELSVYKGVRFEVDEKKTPYNPEDKKVEWEDVQISRGEKQSYIVTFSKGEKTAEYVTAIVVDEKDYGSAKKTYDERFAAYQAALKKRQHDDQVKSDGFFSRLMNADARRIFVNDSVLRRALALRRANVGNAKEDMVMREFVVRDFGIWNSDCPSSLPQGAEMLVKLLDSRTKKTIDVSHVFLVEKGRNAIFTYYNNDLAAFRFNPEAENLLWAVTSDGKLAVVSAATFENIDTGKKEVELTMEVQPANLASAAEARTVLGI